jgi:hypothetical protein
MLENIQRILNALALGTHVLVIFSNLGRHILHLRLNVSMTLSLAEKVLLTLENNRTVVGRGIVGPNVSVIKTLSLDASDV